MKANIFYSLTVIVLFVACSSGKFVIKNIDNKAPIPTLSKQNTFLLTEVSKDPRYGYNKQYPVNIFFMNSRNDTINQQRYLNALAGPNGEEITFTKLPNCCPFATKRSEMGAGFINLYEMRWEGLEQPKILYINIYERGVLKVPMGLTAKKID